MTDKEKLYNKLKENPRNIRFNKLCQTAEAFGFEFKGGKGSHRIYMKKGINEMLNFQSVHGKAKPYQVRQLIKVIEKYNLLKEEDDDV